MTNDVYYVGVLQFAAYYVSADDLESAEEIVSEEHNELLPVERRHQRILISRKATDDEVERRIGG